MTADFDYDSDETVILYGDNEVAPRIRNVNFEELHDENKIKEVKTTDNKGKNAIMNFAHLTILHNRRKTFK